MDVIRLGFDFHFDMVGIGQVVHGSSRCDSDWLSIDPDQEETALNIGEFLERHRDDLESLLELKDGSEFSWQLEDFLSIPSALHSFLQSLPLPENAREIWADYLTLIGVDSD